MMPDVIRCSCVAVHAIRLCSIISLVCACISIVRLKGPRDILIVQMESRSFSISTPLHPGKRQPTSFRSIIKDHTLLIGNFTVNITSLVGIFPPLVKVMESSLQRARENLETAQGRYEAGSGPYMLSFRVSACVRDRAKTSVESTAIMMYRCIPSPI